MESFQQLVNQLDNYIKRSLYLGHGDLWTLEILTV